MLHKDEYREMIRLTKKVYLSETANYLKSLSTKNSYVVESEIPCINDRNIEIVRSDRCFKFKLEKFNLVKNMVDYQSIGYGLNKSFRISNDSLANFEVINGVNGFEFKLNDLPYSISGTFHNLQSINYYSSSTKYYRSLIPVSDKSSFEPNKYIDNERYSVNEKVLLHGLIEIDISGIKFWIYSYKIEGGKYLIIDSKSVIQVKDFETIVDSVIYSLALISGNLARNEIITICSSSSDFESVEAFSFKRLADSIISSMEIVSPLLAMQVNIDKSINRTIDKSTFESLVKICLQNQAYLRSIKILTQSNRLPKELKASAYCVSLETIKSNLIENSKKGIKPIKYPLTASKIIKDLKATLSSYELDQFNSKDVIIKRLEQINQQTNFDSFEKVFTDVGIKLNPFDKDCLKLRDQFLHGKIPFYEDQNNELDFIIYRLHFLICALILKSIGFSGHLKNNVIHFKLIIRNRNLTEPLFRMI